MADNMDNYEMELDTDEWRRTGDSLEACIKDIYEKSENLLKSLNGISGVAADELREIGQALTNGAKESAESMNVYPSYLRTSADRIDEYIAQAKAKVANTYDFTK